VAKFRPFATTSAAASFSILPRNAIRVQVLAYEERYKVLLDVQAGGPIQSGKYRERPILVRTLHPTSRRPSSPITHLASSRRRSNLRNTLAIPKCNSAYARLTPKQARGPFENALSAVSHALAFGPSHRSGRNASGRSYISGERCT